MCNLYTSNTVNGKQQQHCTLSHSLSQHSSVSCSLLPSSLSRNCTLVRSLSLSRSLAVHVVVCACVSIRWQRECRIWRFIHSIYHFPRFRSNVNIVMRMHLYWYARETRNWWYVVHPKPRLLVCSPILAICNRFIRMLFAQCNANGWQFSGKFMKN